VALTSRTALLAGATGLVGRALLSLLLANEHYGSVQRRIHRARHHDQDRRVGSGLSPGGFRLRAECRACRRAAGATRLAVVSAVSADPTSRIFCNRVKGEMEIAIMQLSYESVVIAQPSLLLGDRAALGQPPRSSEI
jgi:uncharacterized protein YbjT (DUF2867 family)